MLSTLQLVHQYGGQPLAVTLENGVDILCVCVDVNGNVYGNPRLLVTPVMGKGSFWTDLKKVRHAGEAWPVDEKAITLAAYQLLRKIMTDNVWPELPRSARKAAEELNDLLVSKHDAPNTDEQKPVADYGRAESIEAVPQTVARGGSAGGGGVPPAVPVCEPVVHRGAGGEPAQCGAAAQAPAAAGL